MSDDAFSADDFIYSFLKAARERQIAAVVAYNYVADGKRISAHTDNGGGVTMSTLAKMVAQKDEEAIVLAAKAVHERFGLIPGKWENLSDRVRTKYLDAVTTAFAAAQAHLGAEKPKLVS